MSGESTITAPLAQTLQYDWPRFWIEQTEFLDLSDAGFLRDPTDSPYGSKALRRLAELDTHPALAMLGEPGLGKSACLAQEHQRVKDIARSSPLETRSMYVDLNTTSDEGRLFRRIFEAPEVVAWKTDNSQFYLHLDSLDEAMLRIETVPHLLAEGLRELPTDRLSLRIACRTAVWPEGTLGKTLADIWGVGAAVFELAPLRRRDVYTALAANDIDPDDFAPKLFGANAVAFAIKPLTLKMLITLYKRNGHLPAGTGELYRRGCLALSEEQNRSRLETGRQGRLNGCQRLRVPGRMAVATTLGNRFAVWNGPEAETLTGDVAVTALTGSGEIGDFAPFAIGGDDVREVLDTGLFSSRGERRMGWAHRSYEEFLAANYLVEKGVPAKTILKALTHSSGGLIPPLAVVGAWAASLDPDVRAALIASDPWSLLRGDLTNWASADLAALVASLLSWVEAGRHFDHFFGLTESFERLEHPDLSSQLRPIITDRTLKSMTRRRALSIAERCQTTALESELLSMAQDRTEDHLVRAGAVSALRTCGGVGVPGCILAMLQSDPGDDPQCEIRGYALEILWPRHITADQLFPLLIPSNEFYVGAYAYFLFTLPETLYREHLPAALAWATSYIQASNLMGEFRDKTLADAIMFKAWEVFEDPTLCVLFQDHVEARLRNFGELCRGTNQKANEAFIEKLETDTDRRRRFLRLVCARDLDRQRAWPYQRNGFVRREDFAWLLAVSPGGATPDPSLSETTLCSFIAMFFEMGDNDQFELVYEACAVWPMLRAEYRFLIDGVPIDSAAANDARSLQQQMQALRLERPPPAVADLPAEIEGLLRRAEQGQWQAWWQLNLALTLTPECRYATDDITYFISNMPGWASADYVLRGRIVATAVRYLNEATTSVDAWLGQQPMPLYRNDLAALRAFILLLQMAEPNYKAIAPTAWETWAPVIVGLPRKGVADRSADVTTVLVDALAHAPTVFIATVRRMISIEKARNREPEKAASAGMVVPFSIVRDLDGCWANDDLVNAVFTELQAADVTPAEYAALLEALLKTGYGPAADHALARISVGAEGAVQIADVLLSHATAKAWPILWPILTKDDEFARALLTEAAGNSYRDNPFYAALDADAVADLYLLMVRLYPPDSDPRAPSGYVGPLDMLPSFRDGAVRYLAATGSPESTYALKRLVAAHPDIPLLPFELSRGKEALRLKSWSPLTVSELLAITDRSGAGLIISATDLLNTIVELLGRYAVELNGAQTPVRDLWDRQGTTQTFRPIDENALSDVITRYLQRELQRDGIFANREVEVKRRPGAPVGQRTDILVNALRKKADGQVIDAVAAVIEVKGCWNGEVFTALSEQLVRDYMTNLRAPVGVFLVGWFDKTHWDPDDNRRRQTPATRLLDVQGQLDRQAAAVPAGFRVQAVVLDIQSPGS